MKNVRNASPPPGFDYLDHALHSAEEADLVSHFTGLPFREFEFQGYLGKRRVVSFGWRYDFEDHSLHEADVLPRFLHPLRNKAAAFIMIEPPKLVHALITEYRPGTTIGWHRDRDVFGEVVGISLLSPCTFRFRRRVKDTWHRYSSLLAPRSMYSIRGPARHEWEHSIPPVSSLRYSVTFRSLKGDERPLERYANSDSPQRSFDF